MLSAEATAPGVIGADVGPPGKVDADVPTVTGPTTTTVGAPMVVTPATVVTVMVTAACGVGIAIAARAATVAGVTV
jgi:hypothetical protein